jgi:hypothetical protein
MPKGNGKLEKSDRFDKLVKHYLDVRTRLAELEKAHEARVAPFKEMREKVTERLLEVMDEAGAEMVRTKQGTVSATVKPYASCSDPDTFIEFVRTNDAYELLDRRPNGNACRDFAQEHGGLPPGIRLNMKRSVTVKTPAGGTPDE